ncbi:PepSY domain-containing protein [Couchioplanes caeruleus]|uniref:PepSY-associated TM helix domain-containing protein n=1 Tax=Couchioplanes caeruleus TaxID=56438 RepID=UPI0020C0BCC2|nr:PepSY domain-containing protein [Couchioplanes caeruleus]UQU65848.1 PepSY domain-containing protein [Couchioplanes caeruleus]
MATITEPALTARGRRPAPVRSFGPLLLRLHFYAGILVAPFVVVAALTGLAYTAMPQVERVVYADELTVAEPGGTTVSPARQVAAARAVHPGGTLTAVRPGDGDATTQVDFTSPELDEEHRHTVYVDPYTGAVTGQLTTWYATTPVKTWFDDLHRNLHLGAAGRHYSEFAASWLWILALGGVVLWWRRRRGTRTVRHLLTPDLAARRGVRRTRGWHAATGMWLTAGLLVLSATGLTWSRYAGGTFSSALDALGAATPSVATDLRGAHVAATGGHHGGAAPSAGGAVTDPGLIDGVLQAARADGLSGPVEVAVPENAATAWTVTQTRNLWPVGRDSVAVDAATGAVTDRVDFADWPLAAKLTRWGINAHMGTLFGIVNQILLAALALGLICVVVWGYRMWWQRRPTRLDRRSRAGAPPARGAWQQLPGWGIAAGVPLVAVLAWVLPLVGVPLVAFLAVDISVGALRNRG